MEIVISASCPLCNKQVIGVCGKYRANSAIFLKKYRVQCQECDFFFTYPSPLEEELSEYNEKYFFNAHGGVSGGLVARAFFSGVARLRVEYVKKYLKDKKINVSQVFEVGPGSGDFARQWLNISPHDKYLVLEPDRENQRRLSEWGLFSIENASAANNPADLVVLSHVLEHVARPVDFLRETTAGLRRGGCLFIEVPCRDWEYKTLDEPHLLFFDKKPLKILLERCGFTDIELSYFGPEIGESARFRRLHAWRERLLALGLVWPFAQVQAGTEMLADSLERAVVTPFHAHLESPRPAWWLRALATKA
jgi:hypothetical protein